MLKTFLDGVGAKQVIRSAVQYVAGLVVALPLFAMAVEAAGLDLAEASDSVVRVLELMAFLAYVAVVRALEMYVSPVFGWLNGIKADIDYRAHGE